MPVEDIAKSFNLGLGMGSSFQQYDKIAHERAVNGKMNEILGAVRERGGDITMIDPSMYTDRIGLEAMGRVSKQLADTEEYKTRIMGNNIAQARHRYGVFQQYMSDIDSAIKEGDQQRVLALMGSMAAQSGTPYRFSPTEDGQVRVGFITPDGEQEKGTMTMLEAYNMLKPYVKNKGRFIRDSVMHESVTQEENLEYLMNPSKWRTGMDASGNQYTMIPQRIMRNGQLVAGFLVAGPGGQRNMTAEEVAQAGLLGAAGGGFRPGGAGGVDKSLEMFAMDYAVGEDGKQQKHVNPYKYDVVQKLSGNGIDPASIAATWDKGIAAIIKANPEMSRELASIMLRERMLSGGQTSVVANPAYGGDALGLSISNNLGSGGQEAPPPKQQKGKTRPERVDGQWMNVTRDKDGTVIDKQPIQKTREWQGWGNAWRNFGEGLRAGEEEYKKKAGHGLFSKEQLR